MAMASTSGSHNGFPTHSWVTPSPNILCLDQLTTHPSQLCRDLKSVPTLCLHAWQKALGRGIRHTAGWEFMGEGPFLLRGKWPVVKGGSRDWG